MKSVFNRLRTAQLMALGIALAAVPIGTLAADADTMASPDCRSIQDNAARLACYDNVDSPTPSLPTAEVVAAPAQGAAASTQTSEPPVDNSPTTESSPAAMHEPLSDEIGQETLSGNVSKKRELAARGRVVRCQESARGKYLFYFDNGQVWRQKDSGRIGWKECSFEVTISKDFFGYTMTRDGEERHIRVAREK